METIEEILQKQIEELKRIIAENKAIMEYVQISIDETNQILKK
jgi:hypothetical protein